MRDSFRQAQGLYPQSGRTERTNNDTKGARQGEVKAIAPDTSTEKRQIDKQSLQTDPNGSEGKRRSEGGQLQDLEPVFFLQRTPGLTQPL